YQFDATLPDKSERRYTGKLEGNRLTLTSNADDEGRLHQIEVKQLNEKRTVLLYQSRLKSQQQWTLAAEVGCTREGTNLAVEG
ncbi:hypothetical protein NL533_34095, partial [Klebsiella pneumoniae]|nr:hypothetical protein [Klebsiella pneumoniae]